MVRRLGALGIACVEATSATKASAVDPIALSCALLDLDLGDGNGVDVAVALRARAPRLPLAFFTAGATSELRARAAAMAPVFEKPDELEAALAWIAAQSSASP